MQCLLVSSIVDKKFSISQIFLSSFVFNWVVLMGNFYIFLFLWNSEVLSGYVSFLPICFAWSSVSPFNLEVRIIVGSKEFLCVVSFHFLPHISLDPLWIFSLFSYCFLFLKFSFCFEVIFLLFFRIIDSIYNNNYFFSVHLLIFFNLK